MKTKEWSIGNKNGGRYDHIPLHAYINFSKTMKKEQQSRNRAQYLLIRLLDTFSELPNELRIPLALDNVLSTQEVYLSFKPSTIKLLILGTKYKL